MGLTIRERVAFMLAGGVAVYGFLRLYRQQQRTIDQLEGQLDDIEQIVRTFSIINTRQTQSLLWLYDQLDQTYPLPLLRHWAISPDFAAYWVQLLREYQPKQVLELGGGSSTLITAQILRQLGGGHVAAVEGVAHYADQTRTEFERYGIQDIADIIHAPLSETTLNGKTWQWYDMAALEHIQKIDLLLVDGPAQFRNPNRMARYPALPLLYDRLTDGALIVLDDANREDETRIAQRWLKEFDGLRLIYQQDQFEKGVIVLQKTGHR